MTWELVSAVLLELAGKEMLLRAEPPLKSLVTKKMAG